MRILYSPKRFQATLILTGDGNMEPSNIPERKVGKGLATALLAQKPLDFPDTAIYPLYAIVQVVLSSESVDKLDFTHSVCLPMVFLDCGLLRRIICQLRAIEIA